MKTKTPRRAFVVHREGTKAYEKAKAAIAAREFDTIRKELTQAQKTIQRLETIQDVLADKIESTK